MNVFTKIKSLYIVACLAFLGSSLQAQSWTATDWQGNSHSISTHVNAGKAVLVDISAHWCGPCWSWHGSKIMEDLYHDFGPDGTDEFMVFFIDGDSQSSVALLQGASGSQGDWTAGTEYPIIGPGGQGAAVASNYSFPGYPTLFLHCGSGAAPEIQRASKWDFWADVMSMCPTAFTNETVDATLLKPDNTTVSLCANGSSADLSLNVYNAGTSALTSFDLELKDANGNTVATQNVSGQNIAHGSFAPVILSIPAVEGAYTATVTNPNGMADPRPNGDSENFTVVFNSGDNLNLTVDIKPDNYGSEITWQIVDDADNVLGSGGPYTDGNTAVVSTNVTVPADGCFEFRIQDSYGDGICCSYGNGYYEVKSGASTILQGGQYAGAEVKSFGINTTSSIVDVELQNSIQLFPNPANEAANLNFNVVEADVTVSVFNTLGELVYFNNMGTVNGFQTTTIPTANLAQGMYFVEIKANDGIASKRLSVTR